MCVCVRVCVCVCVGGCGCVMVVWRDTADVLSVCHAHLHQALTRVFGRAYLI